MAGLPDSALWGLAVLPIVLLVILVARGRLGAGLSALVSLGTAVVIGAVAFGAGPQVLGVAAGKGVWVGVWILYVVWPALLLYHVCSRGGLDRMGQVFSSVLPTEVENILLVAWVLPAFIQGVAGFGTPLAVAAPLLVAMGISKVRAVVLPLVGYHWAVTFGSMGSSFYMGSLTAQLDPDATAVYAAETALLLGINIFAAGILVAFMHGRWRGVRQAAPMLVVVGTAMFVVLHITARIEPSITSLAAGAAGLAAVGALRLFRNRNAPLAPDPTAPDPTAPDPTAPDADPAAPDTNPADADASDPATDTEPVRRPFVVLLPYLYLLIVVLVVMVPPSLREFATTHLLLGFDFPATETAAGFQNPAVETYTPIALLSHPGSFVLLASGLGVLTYRFTGLWPDGALRTTLRRWAKGLGRSSLSIIALTTLATLLVDTGMVSTIAMGAARATGALFPLLSPLIGAIGAFATGSSTNSNALLAALQADAAELIDVNPSYLVAAQAAGSNVGNSLAPVIILIGATAVRIPHLERDIFRRLAGPAAILLGLVVVTVGIRTLVR